jgi:opacity protein-like surface antigen
MFFGREANLLSIICSIFFVALIILSNGIADAADWRVEGGIGYTQGNDAASDSFTTDGIALNLSANGLGGGAGLAANAGVWVDAPLSDLARNNWFTDNLSLGVQYLYLGNSLSVSGTATSAETVSASFKTDLQMNALMFNAALRYNEGFLHPYVGGGFGGVFGSIDVNYSAAATGIGSISGERSTDFGTTAGQVFAGFDYDITTNLYAGVSGLFFFSDTTLNHLLVQTAPNVGTHQMAGMVHVGWKF